MGARRLYKVGSPFNAEELFDMDYEQAVSSIFFAHLNHKPSELVRNGHTDWQFIDISFGPTIAAPAGVNATASNPNVDAGNSGDAYFPRSASYCVAAVDDETGQVSLPSAPDSCVNDLSLKRNYNTVTWSAVAGADRYFVYKANLDGGFGWIGETTGLQFTDDNITPDLTDGPRVGRDPFANAGDYPSTIWFDEQRLGLGRTLNNPNAMYFSRSADLKNMDISRPLVEDDAITIRLVATKVNAINQVVPLGGLLVFGSNGLFRVSGSNEDYLTATPPPRQKRQNGRGASRLKPVVIDDVAFYTPAIGDDVRAANYTFEIDGYKSDNMSIFSPQFFEGFDIISWAFAEDPISVVWAVRSDGALLAFTWEREHEVWGWTLCETQGTFLDVCVIPEVVPGTTIAEHRVYFLVERTINGVRRRFVERMTSAKWEDQLDSCYLDCAVSFQYDEAVDNVFVPHLIGATVDVLHDGNVMLDKVVPADGWLALATPSKKIHVGLRFTSIVETLPLEVPAPDGGRASGKTKTVGKAVLRVVKSRGMRAGRTLNDLKPLKTRRNEPLGQPKNLLTGDYTFDMAPVVSLEATVVVEQRNPLPMTLTAIFMDPIVLED